MKNTEEIERKKQKKLDRNHWMCRIQKYIFGIDASTYYMGYCPFFWMTWVSVLCAPFIILFRIAAIPITKINNVIEDHQYKCREQRYTSIKKLQETPLIPNNRTLIGIANWLANGDPHYSYNNIIDFLFHYTQYTSTDCIRIGLWIDENPDWKETHLPNAIIQQKQLEGELQFKYATTRKIVNGFSSLGPIVFKCAIPAIIIASAYLLYAFTFNIILVIPLIAWLKAFMIIIGGVSLFMFGIIGYDFLANVCFIHKLKDMVEDAPEKENGFIEHLIEFISDTVKVTYKQECPMIIWGEETGKITRRDNI